MSGSNPTPPPDAATRKKRKWMDEMADLTLTGPAEKRIRAVHGPDTVRDILGSYYDSANTPTDPLPEIPKRMDFEVTGPAPGPAPTTRPELFAAMRFGWTDTGTPGSLPASSASSGGMLPTTAFSVTTSTTALPDDDVVMGLDVDPTLIIPEAKTTNRRRRRKPADYDPSLADIGAEPDEAPVLFNKLREPIRPGKVQRVATPYGMLAEKYMPKKSKNNPTPVETVNAMPVPVFTPQTTQLSTAFSGASDIVRDTSDYHMTMMDDPDSATVPGDDLGSKRLRNGLQGPHSVAFKALSEALDQREKHARSAATLPQKNEAGRLHIDKMLAVGDIAPPPAVMQILMEEEPKLYAKNATPQQPKFADTTAPDRQKRIIRYFKSYCELYNQVSTAIQSLSRMDNRLDENKKAQVLEELFGRVDELLNLHPYQTYGWRGDDGVITGSEIGGKGESAAAKNLFGLGKTDDERTTGLGKLIDGFDPDRMFKNSERYRAFLIQRIQFLVGESAPGFGAQSLAAYPVEVLFDMMLAAKEQSEKERADRKAGTTGTST
jgi:hypothetical protein